MRLSNPWRSLTFPSESIQIFQTLFGLHNPVEVNGYIKARLDRDYFLSNIVRILLATGEQSLTTSEIHKTCGLRSFTSFKGYLILLTRCNWLRKKDEYYSLTEEGHALLTIFVRAAENSSGNAGVGNGSL